MDHSLPWPVIKTRNGALPMQPPPNHIEILTGFNAHLLDGGLSDNLGLRGPFQAVTTTDSPWSILHYGKSGQSG